MITAQEVREEAQKIFGNCDDATLLRRVDQAVHTLAHKGDYDLLLGEMDICVDCKSCVTLPAEIATPLAINVNGFPAAGRDRWFNYHLNGPGDACGPSCHWTWKDGAESPLFQELTAPSKLIAFVTREEDADSELIVYGYDDQNNFIRTKEGDTWVDGYRVPTIFGYAVPDADAPYFARIVRIKKAATVGTIRLTSLDVSATTGTLIGFFQHNETDPLYRKIQISRPAKWVRVAFRRRTFKVTGWDQVIPFYSTFPLEEMLRALKCYKDEDIVGGQGHEATAARLLTEEQSARTPPVSYPMQFADQNLIADKNDDIEL